MNLCFNLAGNRNNFVSFETRILELDYFYSLMQSDVNSFWGNVVLDSFDMAYRDIRTILDQQHVKLISRYLNNEGCKF